MNGLPEKRCGIEVSLLPYDLIFKILLLLPAKDLLRLSVVCKTWRRLISSPNFIEAHMSQCEKVLTFLKTVTEPHPNSFSIDTINPQFTLFEQPSSRKRKLQIYLMEFKDGNGKISDLNISGFGEILATCDGLVLARNRSGSLLILNPTTRKILPLKSGTLAPHREESYGFVFSDYGHEYKAVHVFRDESGHTDSEILSLTTMSWKGCNVNVPSFGLFRDFNHKAVAVSGVLYWLPGTHNINYLVSMDIFDEKFVTKDLPVNSSGLNDRLIENGGMLNFVAQMTVYRIQLWTLKKNENDCDEKWVKRYTINMDYDVTGLVPVFMTKNGRCLILKMSKESIYEYDMEDEEMEVLVDGNVNNNFNYKTAFPLVNTLASWENSGPLW